MKFPTIRQQTPFSVTIPALSGGVNLHDTPSEVEDNQLTAANNMWWHKAALRSRPGVCRTADTYDAAYTDRQWISDREVLLTSCQYTGGNTAPFYAARMTQDGGFQKLGKDGAPYNAKVVDGKAPTAFGCHAIKDVNEDTEKQADFLYFLSSGEIIKDAPQGWLAAEPYVPTVMINGHSNATVSDAQAASGIAGVLYEAFNLLTGAFKCRFSSDGSGNSFNLPVSELTCNAGENVTVSVTLVNKNTKALQEFVLTFAPTDDDMSSSNSHKQKQKNIKIDPFFVDASGSATYTNTAIVCTVDYTVGNVTIYISGNNASTLEYTPLMLPDIGNENIVVTAWKTQEGARDRICKMTQCTWFGGDRSGVGGGTRLFVTGNAEEKNLVHWSDVNNPLYFPEKNYAYVGDYSQAVTAFGKQGDLLILFKEHEMYYAQYAAGTEADFALAQSSGTDVTSVMAKFPLTPIHASIGCDCPDSIRLVNNRLVWANSDGFVYMLPSVNQYNERNVRTISRNIFPLLSEHSATALKQAFAGEFHGYYVLLVEDKLYLLDAQTSAFTSFNYYSKEENAQKALPWFVWTLPRGDYTGLMANDTVMHLTATVDGVGRVFTVDGDTDDGVSIPCGFTTKIFDFDRPDTKKAVNQIYIAVSDTPTSETAVSYITEHGETADAFMLESRGDHEKTDAGYMVTHRLTPHVNRVRVFGIRFESMGGVSIGKVLLKFKTQGVIR